MRPTRRTNKMLKRNMKYIKLYEDFYKLIDFDQQMDHSWDEIRSEAKIVPIDDKTISEIHKIDDDCTKCSDEDGTEYIRIIKNELSNVNTKKTNECQIIHIRKFEDEWYNVQSAIYIETDDDTKLDSLDTYWCDQLEGLIKCLKEI